ncbi:tRNA pseudouridine(55) synthase TruB [Solimonas terrae]|uniref:tRNA pseudouridine synthase B n=1 Tax=Solimonas terrae TaxID=1396819 RepID=A0A6M2BW16_9GAMM|nr:tRNA pseudouridine(55) synthase TruB [Solimonas terrae]NGY06147.1 tRNA pseudouridine(55) synthase TruB [Solimonas terrae]
MAVSPRPPRRKLDGILLLDKPLGLSSNDALQKAKRLFNADKAGHTGSLDPLATGMLPICFGEATKLSAVLLESDKEYRAQVRLGEQTSTGDAEGDVIARSDPSLLSKAELESALRSFLGVQQQVPPMYSALKRDGRPLYELAREGQTVVREAREVMLSELELLEFGGNGFAMRVRCSKGTYIRTLAEDICAAAGQRGHLIGLRRTAVTPFGDRTPVSLEQLQALSGDFTALDRLLLSPGQALAHWPRVVLDEAQAAAFRHGRAIRLPGLVEHTRLAVNGPDGELLGIARGDGDGCLKPQRCLLTRT